MAIMATEEPQSIVERKVAPPEPEDEKKIVEETVEPTVNGYVFILKLFVFITNHFLIQPCDFRRDI